jgi:hypothetical protein
VIAANRASAMGALAAESDHLDMAESSVVEFERVAAVFDGTEYTRLVAAARARVEARDALAGQLREAPEGGGRTVFFTGP